MLQRLFSRGFRIGALGAVVLFSASQGQSEPDHSKTRKACGAARKSAHALEEDGHLRQAREAYVSCSKATCSPVVRQDCTTHYAQLAHDIPSIVPLVTDEAGTPLVDVQVMMDEVLLASKLDGRSILVDPGMHEFTFSTASGVLLTQQILIVQGQRNQPISVAVNTKTKQGQKRTLAPTVAMSPAVDAKSVLERSSGAKPPFDEPAAEKPADKVTEKATPEKEAPTKERIETSDAAEAALPEVRKSAGPGPVPYVLGAVGLAGLGAGGLLFYWGRKDNSLLSQCSPDCPQASVDHVRKIYLASDVALGAGLAAFGTGVVWLIAGSGPSKEKSPYAFDVKPSPAGAMATVSGSF